MVDNDTIRYINELADGASVDDSFQFTVGMEVGLRDIYDRDDKEAVRWYTIEAMDMIDDDVAVGMLYLKSNQNEENIHRGFVNGVNIMYAEIVDTISDRIVLP